MEPSECETAPIVAPNLVPLRFGDRGRLSDAVACPRFRPLSEI